MKHRQIMQMKRMNKIDKAARRADKECMKKGRSRYKGLKVKLHRAWKAFRRNYVGLFAILMVLSLTACDAHRDFPDTSMKVGHVLCTDGKVMSKEDCERLEKEPIAVVFHVNIGNDDRMAGNGYAVYLHDIERKEFADSIGIAQGTSADISAYDGNKNTFAIFAATGCESPAGQAVFDMWRYGQSAYIGSVAEMRLLYQSKLSINGIITALGGDPLPDEAGESWYWTSTEVDGQQTAKAWLYSLSSGSIQETPKSQAHKVRPIVTLNN